MTVKDYSTNKLERYERHGINDPAETPDGRQIADDAMRNETWTRTETGGLTDSDDAGWLYQGDGATEAISVGKDVPVQLQGGWEDEGK